MKFTDFARELQKGAPRAVCLLAGMEEFLKHEAMRLVREKVFGDDGPGHGLSEFDADEDPIAAVLDELRTLPMLGGRKLVVLSRAEKLSAQALGYLKKYAGTPSEFSTLVLEATGQPKAGRLTKFLPGALVLDATPLKEREVSGWLRARAERHGLKLPQPMAMLLVDFFGTDLSELDGALEKLALLVGPGEPVTRAHVEGFLRRRVGYDVFKLTSAVAARDAKRAIEVLSDIFQAGIIERDGSRETNEMAIFLRLIPMLGREFRRIYQAKRLIRKGTAPEAAAKELGVHPYYARGFLKDVARYSQAECLAAEDAILRADNQVKTSARPVRLALEECLVRCTGAVHRACISQSPGVHPRG